MSAIDQKLREALAGVVEATNSRVEALTRDQLVVAFAQAIQCGDFQRLVEPSGGGQQVIYVPFREVERFRGVITKMKQALLLVKEEHSRCMREVQEIGHSEFNFTAGMAIAVNEALEYDRH